MRILVAIGVLLGAADLAWGADLPPAPSAVAPAIYAPAPPPVYNWTGFYAGVNVGGSFVTANSTDTFTGGVLGGVSSTGSGHANGAVAGGQVGFNYQIDAFVLGMEGDFDWSGVSSTAVAGCGVGCTVTGKSNVPWIATIRGRAGVALDRVLLYGTGGAAFTDLSQNITATGFGTLFNASSTEVGWTIGAGVEAAIAQNWTVKAEYLYVQTNATLSGPVSLIGGTLSDSGTVKDNIIRGGLNFKYP